MSNSLANPVPRAMKTLLLLSAGLLAAPAPAQHLPATRVPAAAKATFKAKFPAAKSPTWEREGTAYEAGFRLNGKAMSAVITAAGMLRETETSITVSELPAAVRATLAHDYRAYKINEAASILKADGRTVYEAEVAKGSKKQDVLFTAEGKVTVD